MYLMRHAPSGACFLIILVVSFHINLECTSFCPFGPQRKSESLIFTDFRVAHLMIYAFRSPINCSKRVSGEQKPLTNTCSPTRQLIIYPCAMRVFWVVETSIHAPSGACFLGILVLSFHMDFECSQMLTYPVTRVLCHRKSSPGSGYFQPGTVRCLLPGYPSRILSYELRILSYELGVFADTV